MKNQNQIKAKILKRRTGKSAGKYVVRIEYFDHVQGKLRYMERNTEKKSEATEMRDDLVGVRWRGPEIDGARLAGRLAVASTGERERGAEHEENDRGREAVSVAHGKASPWKRSERGRRCRREDT